MSRGSYCFSDYSSFVIVMFFRLFRNHYITVVTLARMLLFRLIYCIFDIGAFLQNVNLFT